MKGLFQLLVQGEQMGHMVGIINEAQAEVTFTAASSF